MKLKFAVHTFTSVPFMYLIVGDLIRGEVKIFTKFYIKHFIL